MDKMPILYTPEQTEEILAYIHKTFGREGEYIAHEIKSQYVHTDLAILAPEGDARSYVTFGMGARPMNAPQEDWERTELSMFASEQLDPQSRAGMILAGELAWLSKFPFHNDTWFGPGHTVGASEKYKEAFGYDCFLFFSPTLFTDLTDIGRVNFLITVPIYQDEREWVMEHDSFDFLLALWEKFDGNILRADVKRAHFIPD